MSKPIIDEHILKLANAIRILPGIGAKGALRIAIHLLAKTEQQQQALYLAEVIQDAVKHIYICNLCRMLTSQELCDICSSNQRSNIICVTASYQDVIQIESSGSYQGYYFLLGGCLSPLEGIDADKAGIPKLLEIIQHRQVSEVMLFLPASTEGEATSFYINNCCRKYYPNINITMPQIGMPLNSSLKFLDQRTIAYAIKKREEYKTTEN